MKPKLEFFYDYVSVYSFLANHAVASMDDVDVIYRPMLLGAVMQATGNRPPATVEAKGRHLRKDVYRWVEHYDIPFKFKRHFSRRQRWGHCGWRWRRSGVAHSIAFTPCCSKRHLSPTGIWATPAVLVDIVTAAGPGRGSAAGRHERPVRQGRA